jgi:transposase-like protein
MARLVAKIRLIDVIGAVGGNEFGVKRSEITRGSRKCLHLAFDEAGARVDFLLKARRDLKAALRFLLRAIGQNGAPKKIAIDKSGANTAAIESYDAEHEAGIEIRRRKYLNDIVEQDRRAIKRVTRPTLGFKSFRSAAATLAGVELMHASRKGQLPTTGKLRPAKQFYALAARTSGRPPRIRPHAKFATEPSSAS